MKKKSLGFFVLMIGALASCLTNDVVNPKVQFKNDTTSISQFLKDNNLPATKTPQGVWYSFDTEGFGIYPVLTDSIRISYRAKLIPSMAQVDSSSGLTVLLSSVISGWQNALPRFPTGSKGKLYIPSGLAFGEALHYNIPPNSNLLYEITLISVKGSHYTSDTTAINSYINLISDSLSTNKITLRRDVSGIRYSYDQLYNSATPELSKSINVSYTGKVLNSKTFFAKVADTTLVLKDQITAWKLIMPKITVGTNVTIYVPSGYGYGSEFAPRQTVGNSNIVYQIKLNKVY
ncbi:MAG: FKBP-type peptidyl-prolyl cis-trans isomerase [Bacteroidetes bacterium]|nr:FKBP-type peptidyl-prolyl cis-trans isomerase [Bacteroidota bacterium]MBI3481932.1 FKBP-type peptidyl-prolyl cis-trans isomerase [Bacteroidota bacterium]